MTKVHVVLGGTEVGRFLTDRWPPEHRTTRNVPRFHPDVTLTRADRVVKQLHRDPLTGEESWGPPIIDPASAGAFVVIVPEEVDRIETLRAALRLLDAVTDGLVRDAAELAVEIQPQR